MTNYHTIVPGAQGDEGKTQVNPQGGGTVPGGQKGHQRPEIDNQTNPGTRIPGIEEPSPQSAILQDQMTGKPIVGFLVSISRTEEGEFWVLRQGQNTIGSGVNSQVVLSESSVSGLHSILAVHRNPGDNNRLNVGLIDRGSSNGTFVNGNYIGFNPYQCKNLDKIKIGNYELLLMLFDRVDHEMKKAENFMPKENFDYSDRDIYRSNDSTRM
ncbi:MAG: FHA domain-containing protein [Mangrovibacterium sp.]